MWTLRLVLLGAALTAPFAVLANVPRPACGVVPTTAADGQRFGSVTDTLEAMASMYLARSQRADREYVGGVLHDGAGRYWATVGAGCPGQDTVTFAVNVPVGDRLVGFWHTHGAAGQFREFFSPDDVALVRGTGAAFYLITARGELRVLRPEDLPAEGSRMRTRRLDGAPPGASAGRLVTRVAERSAMLVNS